MPFILYGNNFQSLPNIEWKPPHGPTLAGYQSSSPASKAVSISVARFSGFAANPAAQNNVNNAKANVLMEGFGERAVGVKSRQSTTSVPYRFRFDKIDRFPLYITIFMKKTILFSIVCILTVCLSLPAVAAELRGVWVSKVDKNLYIYLSPSSQNRNIGFGDYPSEEYRMNQLAQHLKRHLSEAGVKVLPDLPLVTKKQLDDPNYNRPSLRSRLDDSMRRAKELERTEPDAHFYHIALHSNAAGSANSGKVRGMEIFVDRSNPQSVAMGEHLLAAAVAVYHRDNPEEAQRHGNNERAFRWSRGVKDTGNLIEAQGRNTKNGMLIELGFHDEEHDSQWMLRCIAEGEKEGGTNPLAKAMSDAIVGFVNRL